METIDKTQLILITMAMAFCTEGLIVGQLSNFEAIEKTQLKYLNMLHRYLKDKFPENSRTKFAQGMFIITEAQEASRNISFVGLFGFFCGRNSLHFPGKWNYIM